MLGDYVRDKDAVTASLLLTEMAAWYAAQGMTLFDALDALYAKYGYYGEKTLNLVMPGLDGHGAHGQPHGQAPRETPPAKIAGTDGPAPEGLSRTAPSATPPPALSLHGAGRLQRPGATTWPTSTTLVVRPSGTEPKIKVYVLAKGKDSTDSQEKVAKYAAWAETLNELAK